MSDVTNFPEVGKDYPQTGRSFLTGLQMRMLVPDILRSCAGRTVLSAWRVVLKVILIVLLAPVCFVVLVIPSGVSRLVLFSMELGHHLQHGSRPSGT